MSTAGVPRARSLQLLAGPDRIRFLARLAGSLVLAARGEYVEAGQSVDRAWVALRAVNEMVLVISAQLTSAAEGRDPAYPDAAFLDVLLEKADVGQCRHALAWAITQAVEAVGGQRERS